MKEEIQAKEPVVDPTPLLVKLTSYVKKKHGIEPYFKGEVQSASGGHMAARYGDDSRWASINIINQYMVILNLWMEGRKVRLNDPVRVNMLKADWKSIVDDSINKTMTGD